MRIVPFRHPARLIVCVGISALMACGDDGGNSAGPRPEPQPAPDPQPVTAANVDATPGIQFTPNRVILARGGTVTFRFGTVPHNVVFANTAGAPANLPGVRVNEAIPVTFNTAGSFQYDCQIHPGMSGTVVVQ